MEFDETQHTGSDTSDKSMEILSALYDEFAEGGFSMILLSTLADKLRTLVHQTMTRQMGTTQRIPIPYLYDNGSLKMLEYFLERVPQEYTIQRGMLMERLKTSHEQVRENHKTSEERHREFMKRPSPFRIMQEQFLKGETGTAQNTESETMKITDKYNNLIGVLVKEKFLWLCNKADIGRICKYMEENRLVKETGTELARKAGQYFPEVAKGSTTQETTRKIRTAINNAAKEDRQASKIDLKSSAEAVLKYW